ncbi:MAG: amidohydrolase family protein [Pirellulales bacterium]|nr:amidohydrolase family protein [Pirellulales bacterium]
MSELQDLQAIDVHAHFGNYRRERYALMDRLLSADAPTVADRARRANIGVTIVSPFSSLLPRFQADAVAGNEEAAIIVEQTPGLLQWVVINPLQPATYPQAARMLSQPRCVGIKIHPEEHGYALKEHGRPIFRFAADHNATILTHSGEENSLPEDLLPFADEYPEMRLILAHLGCGYDGDASRQVRAIQRSKRGNVFVDTSSMASVFSGLIEWAVDEIGAERILFGTDSPLYDPATQRARIEHAEIRESEKRLILRDNAIRLLNLQLPEDSTIQFSQEATSR